MLPSDMNKVDIKARTAGYNNKISVSNSGFSLGRNDMVNTQPSCAKRKGLLWYLF